MPAGNRANGKRHREGYAGAGGAIETPVVEAIHTEPQVVQVELPVIKTVPAPRPTMTQTIPVSTN
ncbi:MAG TPA: hypothetical protein VKM55_10160 [Candidatus Lokiarchaeia archaeon]|nr:hypothetical protein [Candidatus Lokiarchaeia archaeon]